MLHEVFECHMKCTQIGFAIDRNVKTLNKKINQLEDFG